MTVRFADVVRLYTVDRRRLCVARDFENACGCVDGMCSPSLHEVSFLSLAPQLRYLSGSSSPTIEGYVEVDEDDHRLQCYSSVAAGGDYISEGKLVHRSLVWIPLSALTLREYEDDHSHQPLIFPQISRGPEQEEGYLCLGYAKDYDLLLLFDVVEELCLHFCEEINGSL